MWVCKDKTHIVFFSTKHQHHLYVFSPLHIHDPHYTSVACMWQPKTKSSILLSPPRLGYCTQTPTPHRENLQHRMYAPTCFQINKRQKKRRGKDDVLRCSGTPRISGKLLTGLSVGRTAALCIIVIQTGRQTHAHTPETRWAHSPRPVSWREKKNWWSLVSRPLSSLSAAAPLLSPVMSLIPGWCPCRALLSRFGVNQTGCALHSALQGRRGLTSQRQKRAGGQ